MVRDKHLNFTCQDEKNLIEEESKDGRTLNDSIKDDNELTMVDFGKGLSISIITEQKIGSIPMRRKQSL